MVPLRSTVPSSFDYPDWHELRDLSCDAGIVDDLDNEADIFVGAGVLFGQTAL